MTTIMIVEHAPNRADGILKHLAEASDKLDCQIWRCYKNTSPPDLKFDALILGGGPMMVEDLVAPYCPFFKNEEILIRKTVEAGIPVWGICLGAQIITHLFGGKVEPRDWVIGWHEVMTTPLGHIDPLFSGTNAFNTFQLHRDHIIEIPPGAISLSTSPKSLHEAFRLGADLNVWASVFHPEIDTEQANIIYRMVPELFTANGVEHATLSPIADGRKQRTRMFNNFSKLIVSKHGS